MSDFTIRPYAHTDEDAAKLAVMWNESDDQWPGTFTEGVPMTTERVREWMDREVGLAILVVEDPAQERIVGYGSLWEGHDKENLCYVAVLNVHPAHQGKSHARRMLTRMIDLAVELGYHQMDIGTWSGNLKSVPLYKKVGFFWVPDTSVHMENFVPLIRRLPLAQPYFQRHDWYTTFQRELLQVEDDQRHGAMKVYGYHWEADGERLSVLIDREAKAMTGLETDHLSAYAELDEVEPAHGLPYPIRWRVTNKRQAAINVSILASGDPGIQISQQSTFRLEAGQERVVEGRFTVSPDIKVVKKGWPAPRIKTVLVIGGDVIELGTGVRSRPAIVISTEPQYPVVLPGRASTVHVQLNNRLERPLQGVVSLAPEVGVKADWDGLRHEFSLDAQGTAGLPLNVTCDEAGVVPLRFSAVFETDDQQVSTRPARVPLLSLPLGGIVADIGESGDQGDVILIENEFFRLHCRSEGGRCAIWDKADERAISSIREELGPPFDPSELWFKAYDLSLERGSGWVKAILRARSNNFPGLALTKEITLTASPLMTLGYRLVNEGTQTYTVQLNPWVWMGDRQRACLTLPRAERLVHERAALFSSVHGDVPEKPEGMAERWLAWKIAAFTLGLIWGDDVEEHKWEWSSLNLKRSSLTLEPGAAADMPPLYLYAGPGDWVDVRRTWARMADQPLQRMQPQPGRKPDIGFDPSPAITLSDQVELTLRADSVREQALDGRILIEPPPGWRVEPVEFPLNQLKHEQPLVAPLRLDGTGQKVGAHVGQFCLESDRFDVAEPFTLIRLGHDSAPVQVAELREDDHLLFQIDNGWSRWQVAPDYHAGVVRWTVGQSDVNHLRSAFPQEGGASMGWLKPWFGGIQPILMPDDVEAEGWPGKLYEEQFTAQPCTRTDERGIDWTGLCLTARIKREAFRGLRVEVAYLTVGRSNLLKIVYRLVNETQVFWRVIPGLLTFGQVDGRFDNTTLHADDVQMKRTSVMTWAVVGDWGAMTNPESGRTLAVIKGTPGAWLELSDYGQDGGHVFGFKRLLIPPQDQAEMVVYVALTDSLKEARRYAVLSA
jgi:RimJ/RimL family protein N-acetyltransferase